MLALLACCLLAAEPADWEKDEAAHLKNIHQVTKDFVRAGEGYFSPDGKTIIFQAEEKDSGNPFYQIFTMDLATGKFRRVSPGVGKTTCSLLPPRRQEDHLRQHATSTPTPRSNYAEEYKQRDEDAQGRQAPPLQLGLRPAHDHLRGQPRRHRPEAADRRQGLQRRGQLFARRQADRLLLQPRRRGEPRTVRHGRATARTSAS